MQKLVSGTRRRLKDEELELDIDLTDICYKRIFVMGYPAFSFI